MFGGKIISFVKPRLHMSDQKHLISHYRHLLENQQLHMGVTTLYLAIFNPESDFGYGIVF